MALKRGLSSKSTNQGSSQNMGVGSLPNILSKVNKIKVGRVNEIILNQFHPKFEEVGGYNGLGTIFFEENNYSLNSNNKAKPFFPQISSYPLINELVLIFKLPNSDMGILQSEESFYYVNIVNLWNSPHHNAYPNPTKDKPLKSEQKRDYQKTQSGAVRRVTDESTEILLNDPTNPTQQTFVEKSNISPLLPFPGDNIYQGRWGNSIRLGSTAKPINDLPSENPWSSFGENGSPITLIRNGQNTENVTEGWIPINENINQDFSSIYLTSTQKIPIGVASQNYFSYTSKDKEIPTIPSEYTGNQVIINSGRLLFNSTNDHIMLSSQRTISFEAIKGFNFDTPANFVIDVGTTIKLGSKDATEPLVKGETLRKDLQNLTQSLLNIVSILKYQQLWPAGVPVPDGGTSVVSSQVEAQLQNILKDFNKDSSGNSAILSKVSKTI